MQELTENENEPLRRGVDGLINHRISEPIFLAGKTVKNYVSAHFDELSLERRTQAAMLATRLLGARRDP